MAVSGRRTADRLVQPSEQSPASHLNFGKDLADERGRQSQSMELLIPTSAAVCIPDNNLVAGSVIPCRRPFAELRGS
jgi:hypothetical protein